MFNIRPNEVHACRASRRLRGCFGARAPVGTRLPPNLSLKLTTRECVHLVTRGCFRSRDKDGDYTNRSAVAENPMIHANLMALCFIEPGVMATRSFALWE